MSEETVKFILTLIIGVALLISIIAWAYHLAKILLEENKASKLQKKYGNASKKKSKLLPIIAWGVANAFLGGLCAFFL